jgi:hypothetical protein
MASQFRRSGAKAGRRGADNERIDPSSAMLRRLLPLLAILSTLAACDQLGLESASVTAARIEADGKAVGAGCRHGGRAIEDCFTLNKRVDKAAIYAGWREMDDYMRENKLEPVVPTLGTGVKKTADADDAASDSAGADRAAKAPTARPEKIARIDKSAAEKPAEH